MFFDPNAASSDMDPQWVADHWAKLPCTILPDGNIRTGPVRLSFPWLFDKQPPVEEGNEPKHAATFLFPVGADITLLKQEAGKTAVAKWPSAGQTGGPQLTTPFRDQSEKQHWDGYVAGGMFLTCSAERKPLVLDVRGAPIVDPAKLYPGCWVLGLVRPFAYEKKVKKGVSFGLQGVIFIADDRNLGGGGIDVQAAVQGISISQDVNPSALFGGSGADPSAINGSGGQAVTPASLF